MKKGFCIFLTTALIFCCSFTSSAAYEYPARRVSHPNVEPVSLSARLCNAEVHPGLSGTQPYAIIGDDDTRWKIEREDAEDWPYNMIVGVFVTYANEPNKTFLATGFVISDHVVLTAGHVLEDRQRGEVTHIQVAPGYTGDGIAHLGLFQCTNFEIPSNFAPGTGTDYGVLTFDDNIGNVAGHFGWWNLDDPVDTVVEIAGYPQSKNGQMWGTSDVITGASSTMLYYTMDTEPGNSGSPASLRLSGRWLSMCGNIHPK